MGDLCEVTPSPSSDLFAGLTDEAGGTPVVTPADITDAQRIDPQAIRYVPGNPAGLERYRLLPGDLVVVRLGGIGRIALADEGSRDWVYHSSCVRLRPDTSRVDPAYLVAYLAHSPASEHLLSQAQVGTVPVLTAWMLRELPVALPSPRDQRLMAAALGEVGLQMDIQRRMLERLDAVRQGLFTQLLGDDLPVGGASRPAAPAPERRAPRTRRTNRMS
ncbi:restriction endonuclease subunit S [Streptomyces verrucosisporus]|uniref:restriction endonuclease subunit S n=1 Tax=Streptomyces verrucosisporus TaxID=1695161 RepID=UPI001F1267BC|nr:restriction endonuclease subunit S [Streptomyces verrucosisporus]